VETHVLPGALMDKTVSPNNHALLDLTEISTRKQTPVFNARKVIPALEDQLSPSIAQKENTPLPVKQPVKTGARFSPAQTELIQKMELHFASLVHKVMHALLQAQSQQLALIPNTRL